MKITGTSNYIRVEIDGKTVKILGEMMVGGFLAYSNTIKYWEPPYENVEIDVQTKEKLIQSVINWSLNSAFRIKFE